MTDNLRQAIEQAVAILGPEAPLCSGCVEEWTEALRILNDALAEQPAEQEPVAWMTYESKHRLSNGGNCKGAVPVHKNPSHASCVPLYTAPQPAKQPLTREEIDAVMRKALGYGLSPSRDDLELVRAIERAHGIGEQE